MGSRGSIVATRAGRQPQAASRMLFLCVALVAITERTNVAVGGDGSTSILSLTADQQEYVGMRRMFASFEKSSIAMPKVMPFMKEDERDRVAKGVQHQLDDLRPKLYGMRAKALASVNGGTDATLDALTFEDVPKTWKLWNTVDFLVSLSEKAAKAAAAVDETEEWASKQPQMPSELIKLKRIAQNIGLSVDVLAKPLVTPLIMSLRELIVAFVLAEVTEEVKQEGKPPDQ